MGEIRIVGPGKTRGYPYPVCKKMLSSLAMFTSISIIRNVLILNMLHKKLVLIVILKI